MDQGKGFHLGERLDIYEKSKITKISCEATGEELFQDWRDYAQNRVNYEFRIVYCPSHCWNQKAHGIGAHHQSSSICAGALADGSMSLYGGIVGVSKIKR